MKDKLEKKVSAWDGVPDGEIDFPEVDPELPLWRVGVECEKEMEKYRVPTPYKYLDQAYILSLIR